MRHLYDSNTAVAVLSYIFRFPEVLHQQEQFKLTTADFSEISTHQLIFAAVYNLAVGNGATSISTEDIDLYVGKYPKQHEEYVKNGGRELVQALLKRDNDINLFKYYYNNLKKLTVLRELETNGISTKEFKKADNIFPTKKEIEEWDNLTVEDIIKRVQKKLNKVEDSYVSTNSSTTQKASKGLKELYFELKESPEIGVSLDGEILDYVLRGARLGKMYLNSAPSGHGKTRFMVGNAASIALPRLEGDKVVVREGLSPVLFVTTEQQADEIQTMLISYVSGVNEEQILYGKASVEEERKILMAIDIIEKYADNFHIEVIPDPNIALVRAKLVKHILQNNVSYVFYDYIFSSPGLLGEFRDVRVREDVALMMLSNGLKEIAATYNVFVQSGTQLNDKWEQTIVRNQNHIRGSKAIADKADVGMISIKLEEVPEEFEKVKTLIQAAGLEMPNVVVDIYKNRRGKFSGIKLFRYFDYGTCRSRDIMLTTLSHTIIKNYDKVAYDVKLVDFLDLITQEEGDDDVEIN